MDPVRIRFSEPLGLAYLDSILLAPLPRMTVLQDGSLVHADYPYRIPLVCLNTGSSEVIRKPVIVLAHFPYRDFILEHTKLVAISRVVADVPACDFLGRFLALQCLVNSLPDRTGPLMDDCVVPLSPKSTTTYGLGVVPCCHTEPDGLM